MIEVGGRVLVVDDESAIRDALRMGLEHEGFRVGTAGTGEEALDQLEGSRFDVVVSDVVLPDVSGLDVLQRVRAVCPGVAVIMITGYSTVETAVEAFRRGASDFLVKPFDLEDLALRLRDVLPRGRDAAGSRGRVSDSPPGGALIGRSPAFQAVGVQVGRLAATSSNVLITGESGTGKELVARAIHARGRRRGRRFVPVNCGAIPESLFESHLFGHVKGAFTSAMHAHPGFFALAHQGTLFLDEIGELPPSLQVKLLRVIEDQEVWAVGAARPLRVDCHVIASTNRDLHREVAAGRFREDLFYRLNVARIELPPLRERREDIPLLVEHLLARLAAKLDSPVEGVEPAVMRALMAHDWPGNVRELEHVLERAMIAAPGGAITLDLLPAELRRPPGGTSLREATRRFERQQIRAALTLARDDKREAARHLGLSLASLYRKLGSNAS